MTKLYIGDIKLENPWCTAKAKDSIELSMNSAFKYEFNKGADHILSQLKEVKIDKLLQKWVSSRRNRDIKFSEFLEQEVDVPFAPKETRTVKGIVTQRSKGKFKTDIEQEVEK